MTTKNTSFHDKIMSIQCVESNIPIHTSVSLAYKEGCRDTRHAAAELVLKADAEIERLKAQVIDLSTRIAVDRIDRVYSKMT